MTFAQFGQALTELAPKRYSSKTKDEAIAAMVKLVENKSPGTNAATVIFQNIFLLDVKPENSHFRVQFLLAMSKIS